MDKITRTEAANALVTLRVYAAQKQPTGDPQSVGEARARDDASRVLDTVEKFLGTLPDEASGE